MLREQNRRNTIDGTLSVSWDMDAGRFELETLTLDLPGDNAVSLAMRAEGLPPQILTGGAASGAAAAIEGLELIITNTGFADGLILSALGSAMSGLPGTPDRQMDATRRDAQVVVEDLPDTLLDAQSKAAVGTLIEDAPVPWGTLAITLAADPALPLLRFPALALSSHPFDPAALGFAFDGAKIDIRFDTAPAPGRAPGSITWKAQMQARPLRCAWPCWPLSCMPSLARCKRAGWTPGRRAPRSMCATG